VAVSPAAASTLTVSDFPSPTTAGVSGGVLVTAMDAFGNVATGYRGTVHLTSSDSQAVLEADHTFTAADNGRYSFSATLRTAGVWSITATDTATMTITGMQSGIVVNPAATSGFVVAGYPSPTGRMEFHDFTVTAVDPFGNLTPSYTGTVTFSSDEGHADLPDDYTFTAADAGTHTFSAAFNRFGTFYLAATDVVNPSITGMQSGIEVVNQPPFAGDAGATAGSLSALALASDSSAPVPTPATSRAPTSVTAAIPSSSEISTRSLAASAGAQGVIGTGAGQVVDSLFMDFEGMVLDQRHLDDMALALGT
jgi:hypothetical protein